MQQTLIVNRYVNALSNSVKETENLRTVFISVKSIAECFVGNNMLMNSFRNPLISADHKSKTIDQLLSPVSCQLSRGFFHTLAKKNRLGLLPEIIKKITESIINIDNTQPVTITTLNPVSESIQRELTDYAKHKANTDIDATFITDESILGGFKIEYKHNVIDATVSNHLNQLRIKLKNN